MSTYAAHITTDVETMTDEQLGDLVDALAPAHGVPSMLGGRLSIHLTVEAGSLLRAHDLATQVVVRALRPHPIAIAGIEVLTAAEFDRRLDGPPPADDLIGTSAAAAILGVSRQRVAQLANEHADFPEPVRRGRVLLWPQARIRAWNATWDRRPGPKRPAAPTGKSGDRLAV